MLDGGAAGKGTTPKGGARIVLTAPLTETIDHAGYFIQMSMASLPMWLEGIINRKYPHWRELEYNKDGTARYMPAGVRVLETSLLRRFPASDMVCCYPADLDRFIGPDTRVVAVSTHNPLGVTFAAGVYTSIFGSTSQPINSHYSRELFLQIKNNPHRAAYQVMVGGSGGWQIIQTNSYEDLGVDCVVEGRSESERTLDLFDQALRGERLPRQVDVPHPKSRDEILFPDKRTTFGVVEMTTGCGRRCQFCLPDLNPQIDLPKDKILGAVRANVRDGNKQISLATEDMFIWGQVHTPTPFYFPNREALVDLYASIVDTPGVEEHVLSHSTIAPAVVDPVMIEQLTEKIIDKSPIHIPLLSTHPKKKALVPLIGLETGSIRMAKQIMPSKGVPFPIDEWQSVVIRGLEILNKHNWFPAMTLIVGNPGETDDDCKATLDLIYEVERRGLFAFFIPSIFTPLHDTRMEKKKGVTETAQLTPLQWQLMMKCWKMNLRPGQVSWWGPTAWRTGALALWAWKLRKLNGPGFTWPLFMFASALPETMMGAMGKIHVGRPITVKTRKELLATIKPHQWKFIPPDAGDLPDGYTPPSAPPSTFIPLTASHAVMGGMRARLLAVLLVAALAVPGRAEAWGFAGHFLIMERAIALLPAELRPLFEKHRVKVVERIIDPDTWRSAGFEEEEPNHFLDLDWEGYGKEPFLELPRDYTAALAKFGRARIRQNGTVPWRVEEMFGNLERAFRDYSRRGEFGQNDILHFSAWLAHYVSDAIQPFHGVINYDGQLTRQNGVHARFESALVERYMSELVLTPKALPPIRAPRDFIFERLIEDTRLAPGILKADLDALGTRDVYDDQYFEAFFRFTRPVLERRLSDSIAAVAAAIAGAWEAAGRPPVPVSPPPQPPRRRARP